jgi:hypothetical protein
VPVAQEVELKTLARERVVHGKKSILDRMPGDAWQKFANLRAYYGGFIVFFRYQRIFTAYLHLTSATRGDQHQVKTVTNFLYSVLNSYACHT